MRESAAALRFVWACQGSGQTDICFDDWLIEGAAGLWGMHRFCIFMRHLRSAGFLPFLYLWPLTSYFLSLTSYFFSYFFSRFPHLFLISDLLLLIFPSLFHIGFQHVVEIGFQGVDMLWSGCWAGGETDGISSVFLHIRLVDKCTPQFSTPVLKRVLKTCSYVSENKNPHAFSTSPPLLPFLWKTENFV